LQKLNSKIRQKMHVETDAAIYHFDPLNGNFSGSILLKTLLIMLIRYIFKVIIRQRRINKVYD
jgi:hypothetical protein